MKIAHRVLFPFSVTCLVACDPPVRAPAAQAAQAPMAQPATAPAAQAAPTAAAVTQPATAPTAAPAAQATAHFGGPLSAAAAIPAATLISDPTKFNGKTVKVSGQVGAVCQAKGCWMTLGTGQPGEPTMRVSFKDYGFFVPRDSLGHQAVVEGQFAIRTMPVAEAQHYEEDAVKAGQKPVQVTKPQEVLAMVATGVEMK